VDEIIVFHALTRDHLARIVDIQLASVTRRMEARHVRLDFTAEARALLIDEGFDPTYGARPLKRTIQRLVLDPLALKVLQGDVRDGDAVTAGVQAGALVFTARRVPAQETAGPEEADVVEGEVVARH
jgi:ATP-dependent Clp protease ATP-binding subunit ClpA